MASTQSAATSETPDAGKQRLKPYDTNTDQRLDAKEMVGYVAKLEEDFKISQGFCPDYVRFTLSMANVNSGLDIRKMSDAAMITPKQLATATKYSAKAIQAFVMRDLTSDGGKLAFPKGFDVPTDEVLAPVTTALREKLEACGKSTRR